jgi:hypothetical protein
MLQQAQDYRDEESLINRALQNAISDTAASDRALTEVFDRISNVNQSFYER